VPDQQKEKKVVLLRIRDQIKNIKDKWIEQALDVPGKAVRDWVDAMPFTFNDLPSHLQDALRGTKQSGYLIYFYPAVSLNDLHSVQTYARMINTIEERFPKLLTGSDAVVFNDILELINHDGKLILLVIFLSVGVFIWINVRKWSDTLLSYLPLLIALPVGMGLMALFDVKFNIFNIAIIPTFVAMGIDVPIHIVHRTREIGSGFKAARDLAASINLALVTAGAGFGVLVFARAGVLKSLGWISLLATAAIWWVGLFLLPAYLEKFHKGRTHAEA
jgi:predicted RND superfamily exporter protein